MSLALIESNLLFWLETYLSKKLPWGHGKSHTSIRWEIANAFSAKFKRNPQTLSLEEAKDALDIYKMIPIRFVDIDLSRAVEIAHALNIYAYDAFILAATERYQAPLLSLDKRCIDLAKELKLPILEVL